MANFQYTSDLKAEALLRAGEPANGNSDYEQNVLGYLNRAYTTLALGGLEYNEHIQEEWWWLRKANPGVLTLLAPIKTGTISLTNNSAAVVFSVPPPLAVSGWFLRIDGVNAVFRISAHTAAASAATLDGPYIGATKATATYVLFKCDYDLASDVMRLDAPMEGYMDAQYKIEGMELSSFDHDWPKLTMEEGIPTYFAPVAGSKVRFNRYGTTQDGGLLRVEYNYMQLPTMLTNATNEEPIVPWQYRYLLAEMAAFEILFLKDDNRIALVSEIVKRGVQAMAFENRHRMTNYTRKFAKILPRQDNRVDLSKRSASGFIIK